MIEKGFGRVLLLYTPFFFLQSNVFKTLTLNHLRNILKLYFGQMCAVPSACSLTYHCGVGIRNHFQ